MVHRGRSLCRLHARILFVPGKYISKLRNGAQYVALTVDVISAAQTSQMYLTPPSVPLTAVFFLIKPILVTGVVPAQEGVLAWGLPRSAPMQGDYQGVTVDGNAAAKRTVAVPAF